MEKRRILISGADGYIAMHLIKKLREQNFSVYTASRTHNADLFMDFSKPEQIVSTEICDIDTMIHTVSPNENLYQTDVYRAASENAAGIHAALDFCLNNHIKNFIYFSSFHVFGEHVGNLDETAPTLPCSEYGLAHLIAEQTVQLYDRQKELNAWIIRPSNLFGVPESLSAFQRWNLIPFAFCKEAVEQKAIFLLSSGEQLRNFVGINDVVRKIVWILNHAPDQHLIHAFGLETISVYDYARRVQAIGSDLLGEPIQLYRPEGFAETSQFSFTSVLNNPDLLPKDDLNSFITDMITTLMKYHE